MKFTIWVKKEIEIVDSLVPKLCEAVNERYDTPGLEVFPEELIHQAILNGVIDAPGEFDMDWNIGDDDLITPSQWKALSKTKKKSKSKKAKPK